jgi:hypothetical protein
VVLSLQAHRLVEQVANGLAKAIEAISSEQFQDILK